MSESQQGGTEAQIDVGTPVGALQYLKTLAWEVPLKGKESEFRIIALNTLSNALDSADSAKHVDVLPSDAEVEEALS